MNKRSLVKFSIICCLIASLGMVGAVAISQQRKIRKVKRVPRPTFAESDWRGVYFENVNDALVGERPAAVVSAPTVATNGDSENAAGEFAWSQHISAGSIEDEIKSLLQQLNRNLTTPVKFKTTYIDVNQNFAELTLCFAIVSQFDGDIRWKDDAANALAAMKRATVLSRTNTDQAYTYCNSRKFELTDLVRGESFPEVEKPKDEIDWSNVIDRSPAMVRLELSDGQLKQWTSNESEFESNADKILRESEWVAAIAQVIAKEDMDDADDDDYLAFCVSMGDAARETGSAVKTNDFEKASKFANLLSQSCSNCHEEWRARP